METTQVYTIEQLKEHEELTKEVITEINELKQMLALGNIDLWKLEQSLRLKIRDMIKEELDYKLMKLEEKQDDFKFKVENCRELNRTERNLILKEFLNIK